MSTIVISDTHAAATAETPRPRRAPGTGLSFAGVVRGEWIKLLSLRSIRWSVALMLVLSWGGAALMGWAISSVDALPASGHPDMLVYAANLGIVFTVLIVAALGAVAATSEYSSGLIRSSLTAVPNRIPVQLAKCVVVGALSLAVGLASVAGGAAIAGLFIDRWGLAQLLIEPRVLQALLGATAYLALAALMSLGIGALMRSGVAAITASVVLLFVSPVVFQVMTVTGWAWVPEVAKWLPANLGEQLYLADTGFISEGVGYWPALAGLAVWAAVVLVPAAILLKTRDAV